MTIKIIWSLECSAGQGLLQNGKVRSLTLFTLSRDNETERWLLAPKLPGLRRAIPYKSEESAKLAAPRILKHWLQYLRGERADYFNR